MVKFSIYLNRLVFVMFYTVKLRITGVYINFLIFAQKDRLWVLCKNRLGEEKYEKYENFYLTVFSFVVKFSIYLNRRVFRNVKFEQIHFTAHCWI